MIPKKFSKYTLKEFRKDFATDEICLKFIFKQFYGQRPDFDKFYLIKGRKEFVQSVSGEHISPLANTIFHKSSTPLTTWFEIIYKFANSINGVSATEIMLDFGMTYKCAWRIAKQVRTLFDDNSTPIGGFGRKIEINETYIGGKGSNKDSSKRTGHKATQSKTAVVGTVEIKTEKTKSKSDHQSC
jgi:transposase